MSETKPYQWTGWSNGNPLIYSSIGYKITIKIQQNLFIKEKHPENIEHKQCIEPDLKKRTVKTKIRAKKNHIE